MISEIPKLLLRKEDVIVYGVKRCTKVERNNDGGFARVRGEEYII